MAEDGFGLGSVVVSRLTQTAVVLDVGGDIFTVDSTTGLLLAGLFDGVAAAGDNDLVITLSVVNLTAVTYKKNMWTRGSGYAKLANLLWFRPRTDFFLIR